MISHQGGLANTAPQWARTGDSSYGQRHRDQDADRVCRGAREETRCGAEDARPVPRTALGGCTKFAHGTMPAAGTVLILPHVSREIPEMTQRPEKAKVPPGWQQFLRPTSPDTAPSWARTKPTRFAVSRSIRPSCSP